MINASEALDRLREGNARFVSGEVANSRQTQSSDLAAGQEPFAVVLGCADSRVPVETIFDQGFGDVFVIRVAGNIVTPPILGSVEFAALQLGTRMVLVLGHTNCGAISATLEELHQPSEELSPGLSSIMDAIRPAIEGISSEESMKSRERLMDRSIRANIQNSVMRLSTESEVLGRLIREDGLLVLGAQYSLETGAVEFLEDPAPAA